MASKPPLGNITNTNLIEIYNSLTPEQYLNQKQKYLAKLQYNRERNHKLRKTNNIQSNKHNDDMNINLESVLRFIENKRRNTNKHKLKNNKQFTNHVPSLPQVATYNPPLIYNPPPIYVEPPPSSPPSPPPMFHFSRDPPGRYIPALPPPPQELGDFYFDDDNHNFFI